LWFSPPTWNYFMIPPSAPFLPPRSSSLYFSGVYLQTSSVYSIMVPVPSPRNSLSAHAPLCPQIWRSNLWLCRAAPRTPRATGRGPSEVGYCLPSSTIVFIRSTACFFFSRCDVRSIQFTFTILPDNSGFFCFRSFLPPPCLPLSVLSAVRVHLIFYFGFGHGVPPARPYSSLVSPPSLIFFPSCLPPSPFSP